MATEKFHYTTKAGEKIVLPRFDSIPTGVIRATRKLAADEQMFAVLETVLGEGSDELTAIDQIPTGELAAFVQKWQKHSGITAGESTAS